MDWKNIWKKIVDFNWKGLLRYIVKYIVIVLIIVIGMLLAIRLIDLLMILGLYSWFFQSITRIGGINEYIAGAVSVWFTVVVLLLLPIALSSFLFRRFRRQIKGLLIIATCFSLWFVILYFLSQPREGEYFNTITGAGRVVWFNDPQGKINILPLGYKFDPRYGIKTQLITSPVLIDYEKQLGLEADLKRKIADQELETKNLKRKLESAREEIKNKNRDIETLRKQTETEHDRQKIVQPPSSPKPKYEYKQPVFISNPKGRWPFRFEILSVKQENSRLKLDLFIRSLGGDITHMELVRPEETALIVDAEGNQYSFLNQENFNDRFPRGVDIRISMTFLAPTFIVRKINLVFQYEAYGLKAYSLGPLPTAHDAYTVIFRNLDLNLMKLVEPL